MFNNKTAFSFVELIITTLILAIIGATTVTFFAPIVNLFFYSPSQLMVDQTSQELLSIIIEGDNLAKGLRFAKSIDAEADEDKITFTTCDGDTVEYRWDLTSKRMYRNVNNLGEELIPRSYSGSITVKGEALDTEIFQYYDAGPLKLSVPVSDATLIESIRMNITVESGSGDVKEYHGRISVKAGVDVKQFG